MGKMYLDFVLAATGLCLEDLNWPGLWRATALWQGKPQAFFACTMMGNAPYQHPANLGECLGLNKTVQTRDVVNVRKC